MVRFLVKKTPRKIQVIRIRKGQNIKTPLAREIIAGKRKEGFKLVNAKSMSAARKPFLKKTQTTRKIRRR